MCQIMTLIVTNGAVELQPCYQVTGAQPHHQGGQFFLGLVPRSLTAASATDKVRIIQYQG